MAWHAELMKIKDRNPAMDNVYPEIVYSFGLLAIANPVMCQHLIGKNIKHYATLCDHVIWGARIVFGGARRNGSSTP